MPTIGLVALQMVMKLDDYTESGFQAAIDRYTKAAMDSIGDDVDGALLVFPEHLGFLLPVVHFHHDAARAARSFRELVQQLAGSEPSERRGLWFDHAAEILDLYETSFSTIARTHGVYIVGGSVTTPILDRSPHRTRELMKADHAVYNVSPLFAPSGCVLSHTVKVRIPPGEDRIVHAGSMEALTPVKTAIGSIGTALCFDGYHERIIERLDAHGAQIVAQPTHFPGREIRYDGTGTVIPKHEDFGRLLQGRENIRVGVSAALVGEPFADRRAEGKSHIVINGGRIGADWADVVVAQVADPLASDVLSVALEL